MNINETDARGLISDYYNAGNARNFQFDGSPIKAFLFKRKQLNDLFKDNESKELFMMLALSNDSSNPPDKYLNIVIGSLLNNNIDMGNLIISDDEPYTGTISFLGEILVKFSGDPITGPELNTMQTIFTTSGSNDHLTSSKGLKIKGYTLDRSDLTDLYLTDTVTATNQNDLFAFLPVIRPIRVGENTPFDRPYLSLAVARFNLLTMKVSGTIVEYCLPCPKTCPNNF